MSGASFNRVRDLLARDFAEAACSGRIYWARDEVEDWSLRIGKIPGRVRYVPTFAYRQLLYDAPPAVAGCRLCAVLFDSRLAVREIIWPRLVPEFHRLFALRYNSYPYLDLHILATSRSHVENFQVCHYIALLDFIGCAGLKMVSVQVRGSGATVPEHAHASIADESLPIFDMERAGWLRTGRVRVDRIRDYPGATYVISGGTGGTRAAVAEVLTRELTAIDLSYNLFIDFSGCFYVIPRTIEYSPRLGSKIGAVEVAGIYLGNALGSSIRDLRELKEIIRRRCQAMRGETFLCALHEALCTVESVRLAELRFADYCAR